MGPVIVRFTVFGLPGIRITFRCRRHCKGHVAQYFHVVGREAVPGQLNDFSWPHNHEARALKLEPKFPNCQYIVFSSLYSPTSFHSY